MPLIAKTSTRVGHRGIDMLEFIGLCTCIYLAIRLFPAAVKFGVKLAVALLIILFVVLMVLAWYPHWLLHNFIYIA